MPRVRKRESGVLQANSDSLPFISAAAKREIASIITSSGMREVTDKTGMPSGSFFTGTITQFGSAMNKLVLTSWVRPVQGMSDVGDLWELTPAGASKDIIFTEFLSPFHG